MRFVPRFISRGFLAGVACGVLLLVGGRTLINETEFADRLVGPLLVSDSNGNADAIVVLGAGVIGDCVPNLNGVRRVLHAARLWQQKRAPIVMFTGGAIDGACAVAEAMARLASEIGVPRSNCLVETSSLTTKENGELSAPLLHAAGARRVLVVTDRLHMRRAAGAFTRMGFDVGRVSVPIYEGHIDNVDMLMHGARELAALTYYRMRGWLGPLEHQRTEPTSAADRAESAMSEHRNSVGQLVVFGASYAKGWSLPGLAGLTTINQGVAGQQSFEMLERFERDVVAAKPAAVILWGFINDIFRAQDIDASQARIRASFTSMVALARQHGIEPILATEVTVRPADSWSEAVASWVGWAMGKESYQDRINRHVMDTNKWLTQQAQQERLLLLDLHGALADASGRRRAEFIDADGSHITPAGYAALTAYAEPLLKEHLSAR